MHIIRTCYISEYYEDILQHKKSFWAAKGDMRMYDVTYAPMIDMKDLYTGQVYTGTRSKWIEYLAQSGYDIMQNLQISGNDMIGNGVTLPRRSRRYWFYDEKGRTYDARLWSKEIEKTREEWLRSRWRKPACNAVFRREPIPRTGKKSRAKIHRRIRMLNECRQNADPEYAEFIRPKRRSHTLLMLRADAPYRGREKSWKAQQKTRHQWKS